MPVRHHVIAYGGDYYPEQWPVDTWPDDVSLMRQAGVNLVTVGVFSWALLEPEEGRFQCGWLRDLLDLLGAAGIGVDLATPTAAPPPWATMTYQDILPVDEDGITYGPGSRQSLCVLSPSYRRLARSIVQQLAEQLGDHPAVRMWHVHNEYGCHVPYCYCSYHEAAFRSWLQLKYGTIGALNEAWHTTFWGQIYGAFDQVCLPGRAAALPNPGHSLDHKRFNNASYLDAFLEERDLIKASCPGSQVTTNFMGFFKPLDYFSWASHLDVVSTDNYPDPALADNWLRSAMHYDLIRSLNLGAPWMVMEQTTSRTNWRRHNVAMAPGQMRALTYQALARGASGIMFFQWKASSGGAEKFHSAMVPHAGRHSPVWDEVRQIGQELSTLGALVDADCETRVSVLFSWDNWWAMEAPGAPSSELTIEEQLMWMVGPIYERSALIDFRPPGADLSQYRMLFVPSLYLVSKGDGQNIVDFVHQGGTSVISFWSGIVDENDRVHNGPYGGPLRPIMGCDVVDVAPLPASTSLPLEWEDGSRTCASFWLDICDQRDGHPLARVADGPWKGRPVVLETTYGSGRALYLGARLDRPGMDKVFDRAGTPASPWPAPLSPGLERLQRAKGDDMLDFVINHSDRERSVDLKGPGTDLITGRAVPQRFTLGPWGLMIVRSAWGRQHGDPSAFPVG